MPLRAPTAEEAKLLASTPGDGTDWEQSTEWVVASGGATLAFKACPTECFGGACTPVVVLHRGQALKLPLAKGSPDECMPVESAGDLVLLERANAVLLFDARTGALLLEIPGERNAALAAP